MHRERVGWKRIPKDKDILLKSKCTEQETEIEVGHEFIRRIVPKGKSFDEMTQADIDLMMDHINSYRRKKMNGRSPYEAFCFYYGKELAQKQGCHKVDAADINLTHGLLKK